MDTKTIETCAHVKATVQVPGSKSYSHRYLIAAALAKGESILHNMLEASDTAITAGILSSLGVDVAADGTAVRVAGQGGLFEPQDVLYVGDSGTSARFALALAALGAKPCTLDGSERMRQRPMGDLAAALRALGCEMETAPGDCLPIRLKGTPLQGGRVVLDCSKSSQYLSALLLIAPLLPGGLVVEVAGELVSRPYVDMTVDVMAACGVGVDVAECGRVFRVAGEQDYRCGDYTVEADVSQAGYFWAAAAITKGSVLVRDVRLTTKQGDVVFARLMEQMGCAVTEEPGGVRVVCEGPLRAFDADLSRAPDIVPTLAVAAAFAQGRSVMRNVAHLRYKESDRIAAVINELGKMGVEARYADGDLYVTGGKPKGAVIETYNDHRMAMSFAVAGLGARGQVIGNPGCVAKSFPDFWKVFQSLYQ